MRSFTILAIIACIAVVAVSAEPTAPIKKGAAFQGGAAVCKKGEGVVAPTASGNIEGCAPCLAGYFQAGEGTLACTACPSGTWSPIGSSSCYACPAGTISGSASDSCTECGFGTVSMFTQYYSEGAWRVQTNNKGNMPSSNTNYKQGISGSNCYPCAVNFYQPKAAQTTCLPCPPNTSTANAEGAGACFAVGGGNTIGFQPSVGAAKSLMEVSVSAGPTKDTASGKISGSKGANVKSAKEGPKAPVNKSRRGSYKPQPARKSSSNSPSAKKARFLAAQE
jgi:hypothetical protein